VADADKIANLVRFYSEWAAGELDRLEGEIREREEKVAEYVRLVGNEWREIAGKRKVVTKLREVIDEEQSKLEAEFEKVEASDFVLSLDYDTDGVELFTRDVLIRVGEHVYSIGRFKCDIFFDGIIRIRNVANSGKWEMYDHPHIRDGEPCWGNLAVVLSELVAEAKFSVVVALIRDYLGSYNQQDAYVGIETWPEGEHCG